MDGERNHMKRKEPAEAFDLNLRSGNINSTEQAGSSNSQANNEASCSLTPSQQNQVNPELGFAMLAGENRNPWRNIRQRINGPPFGTPVMNSNVHLQNIGSTSQRYPVPQQNGGHPSFISLMHSVLHEPSQNGGRPSFISLMHSVLHEPFRGAQAHNLIMGLTSGLRNRGEGMEAEPALVLEWEEEPDMHDDLRLDIDNMSYEELLALGEQIGTVSTGLAEDAIDGQMRRYIYPHPNRSGPQMAEAQCCICLEGFHGGDLVGRLDCDHEYHYDCIKEWLLEKNTCPICKSTGLSG